MASERIEKLKRPKPNSSAPPIKPAGQPDSRTGEPNPAKAKPPAVAVRYACGHERAVKLVTGCPCPACQEEIRRKAAVRRKEKNAAKQAAKDKGRAARMAVVGRLPDGSTKSMTWDAVAGLWHGMLVVPGAGTSFSASGSSEKKCLHGLHDAYAAWLVLSEGGAALESAAAEGVETNEAVKSSQTSGPG